MTMNSHPFASKLFIALDVPDKSSALALVKKLAPLGVRFKIGMQLYYAEGPALLKDIRQVQEALCPEVLPVFVDLKLHDIPTTVAKAVGSLVKAGAGFLNVHALGGEAMMRAARQAADEAASDLGITQPKLIGVTVLTSHSQTSLAMDLKLTEPIEDYVLHLAEIAKRCGLDGVVCSAQEASLLGKICRKSFLKVTPGIRLPEDNTADQSRVLTPGAALLAGATHLVVGRPITAAKNPEKATQAILADMAVIIPV